jgi:predicted TIM-barrel fold metal-dependent hydrolase
LYELPRPENKMNEDDHNPGQLSPRETATPAQAKGSISRRDLLRTGTLLASAATIASAGLLEMAADPTGRAEAAVKVDDGNLKVIDFRCRPPLKPYSGLYNLRLTFLATRPNRLNNPATQGTPPPAVSMVGKPGAMKEWWKEIDAAGVDIVVSNGRYAAGDPTLSMDSKTLADLQKQYKDRFFGLAAINLDQPMDATISELEGAIKNMGLRGANFEPGYRSQNGGPATIDNADFYPIFETMIALDAVLMVQTGAFAGLESFGPANDMSLFDQVKVKFPKLKVLLARGGYPSMDAALALALKHPNVYICPDVYMFWPGGQTFQMNLDLLPDQFVYGSAFPFGNIDTTLQQTLKLPVSKSTLKSYLYDNAAQLLKL